MRTVTRHCTLLERGSNIAPYFIELLYDIIVIETQDTRLDASAQGSPEPKVTWEKEGRPLTPNKEYKYVSIVAMASLAAPSSSSSSSSSEWNSKDRKQPCTFVERK